DPTDNNKDTKKENQVNHNAPIDIDESNLNDTKKKKQFDHNASIDVDESDPNLLEKDIELTLNVDEISKTQDTTACTNSSYKPKYRKHINHNAFIDVDKSDLNNNSKKATKGTCINHNSPINFNECDTNLSEKNIALNIGEIEILETQDIISTNNIHKSKKRRNHKSLKKLDKDMLETQDTTSPINNSRKFKKRKNYESLKKT
ncbi:27316_t:CDS:2, partial [Dentiscutata erythropus]